MKTKTLTIASLILFSFTISFSQTNSGIPFIQAKGYFVKNTFKPSSLRNCKIQSKEQFEEIFGMATVMGKDGKPTPIDFLKQFVIAVIQEETNRTTELTPQSIKKIKKNKMEFHFEIKTGEEQTFSTTPCLVIVVDKKYRGNIIFVPHSIK